MNWRQIHSNPHRRPAQTSRHVKQLKRAVDQIYPTYAAAVTFFIAAAQPRQVLGVLTEQHGVVPHARERDHPGDLRHGCSRGFMLMTTGDPAALGGRGGHEAETAPCRHRAPCPLEKRRFPVVGSTAGTTVPGVLPPSAVFVLVHRAFDNGGVCRLP